MTEEDMQWFQGAYQACSRYLFRVCFDDWLQVIKRWKLSLGQEVPEKYKSPPANGKHSVYQDEVFGIVNLGIWLNSRKHQARNGNIICREELLQIGQCLGLEELWWKSFTTKPKTIIEWVAVCRRWKAWHETLPENQQSSEGVPIISKRLKRLSCFNDEEFGEIGNHVCYTFDHKQKVANGRVEGRSSESVDEAQQWLEHIGTVVFNKPKGWWRKEKKVVLSLEEYVELYKGWKVWYDALPVEEHHKSNMPPTKGPKQAYNGINLGNKLNSLKSKARKLGKEAAAKRRKKVKEAAHGDGNDLTNSEEEDGKERVDKNDPRYWLDCIGEVFGKPKGWWKSAEDDDKEEPETPEEWKGLCQRWKAKQSKKDQKSNKMPPETRENKGSGKTGIFEDEIYGVIELGNKITKMKSTARGTSILSHETRENIVLILDAIGEVFGRVAGWWKTVQKPETDDDFVKIFHRWKDEVHEW